MPFVSHPRIRKFAAGITALTAVLLASAGAASAATCQTQPTSTPFAQWGTTSSYFLAPGGSFEGSAPQVGWTLTNASLTPGNEPWHVNSPTDNQSLTINAGGSATSPYFCVDTSMPYFGFFARQVNPGGSLEAQLVQQSAGGAPVPVGPPVPVGLAAPGGWGAPAASTASALTTTVDSLSDGSTPNWTPVPSVQLASELSIAAGQSSQVAIRFSVPGATTSWQIDDVYIDPFRAG